jgi:hypothetical protein
LIEESLMYRTADSLYAIALAVTSLLTSACAAGAESPNGPAPATAAAPVAAAPAAGPAVSTPNVRRADTAAPAPIQDDDVPVTELPVTRAVLFSSGVGYFEHVGAVRGDSVVRLRFKEAQINDVLKSMVLTDLAGTVSSVTYPSQDPLERALRSFAIDISGNPSLAELLMQVRGARVSIAAPEAITGTILGIETQQFPSSDGPPRTEAVLTLVTTDGIRSIPMRSIQRLELTDARLRDELNRALGLLAESFDTERKPVDIRFEGQGERDVRIGYLVETPVWKTSYRLDLSGEEPLLQGWAIVENTSDHDWEQVNLRLVSGRPISFIQDLYTPLYLPRPVVEPELYASLTPQMYDKAVSGREMEQLAREDRRPMAPAASAPARRSVASDDARYRAEADAMSFPWQAGVSLGEGVASLSEAGALGDLFEFNIRHPVDMPRRQSAMLPIVNEPITAERVSIYNRSVLSRHPLNGVMLTNDTDLKLMGGPVTVFDSGAYAGDAQLGHIGPGEDTLLSFAVDLSVLADATGSSDQRITSVKVVRGVMHVTHRRVYEQTYVFENNGQSDRLIMVEHPIVSGRNLVEPSDYDEKTENVYRFRVPVDAGVKGEFVVREQQPVVEQISILNSSEDVLKWYVTSSHVSGDVREALERAMDMRQEIAQIQTRRNDATSELNSIKQGQSRLRENLASVGAESALGQRYLTRLAEEEDRIEVLEEQIRALTGELYTAQNRLSDFLDALTIE